MIEHCITGLDEAKDRRVTHPVRKEKVNRFPRPSQYLRRFLDTLLWGSEYVDEGIDYVASPLHLTVRRKVAEHCAIARSTGRDFVRERPKVWGGTEDCVRQSEVMKPFARSCLGSVEVNDPGGFRSAGAKAVVVQLRAPDTAMDVNRLDFLPLHP